MADAGGIRAGRAYIELGVNDKIAAGLARARARLLAFSATLRNVGAGFERVGTRMAAFGVGAAGALGLAVRSFASQGDTLDKMSKRTGMSVESLSELSYAAQLSGASLADVEAGTKRMQRSLIEATQGSKTAREAFERLGLSVDALARLNADQQFGAVGAALARVSDPATRTAAALELFGRGGASLLPMLGSVESQSDRVAAAIQRIGAAVNTKALAQIGIDPNAFAGLSDTGRAMALTQSLREVADPAKRAQAAVELFGVAGRSIIPGLVGVGDGLQALRQAASAAGGALKDDVDDAITRLSATIRAASDGSKTAADALGRLGLSAGDLAGLRLDEQFSTVATALAQLPDPGERAAAALGVFGRGARGLLAFTREATGGLAAMRAEARALGLTISTQDARAAAQLGDAFSTLKRVLQSTSFAIGSALAPALLAVVRRLSLVTVGLRDWISQNKGVVQTIGAVTAGVLASGGALIAAGVAFKTAGVAISGLAAVLGGLKVATLAGGAAIAALASPVGLAVAALGTLGTAALVAPGTAATALQWLMQRFAELQRVAGRAMSGIADSLATGDVTAAATLLWAQLKAAFEIGVAGVLGAWERARTFLTATWIDVSGRMESAFIGACYGVSRAFHEVVAFLRRTWTGFEAWFLSTNESLAAFFAKRWLEVQGMFDPTLNVDAAKESVDQQTRQRQAEIAGAADDKRGEIEASRRDAVKLAQEQRDRAMQALAESQAKAEAGLVSASGERISQAQSALRDAEAKLRAAQAQAKLLREAAEGWTAAGLPQTTGLKLPNVTDVAAAVEQKVAVQGTFLASSVGGLAGASTGERLVRGIDKLITVGERGNGLLEQALENES